MINRVTITGADRDVHPEILADLSAEYPFVEWGVLASRHRMDSPRYPGKDWLKELARVESHRDRAGVQMRLSLHICGEWSREFLRGGVGFLAHLPTSLFDRVQVNANATQGYHSTLLCEKIATYYQHEFIFQHKGGNEMMVEKIGEWGLPNVSALFDSSGGRGVLPKGWPVPLSYMRCGYAGGLGPENLEAEMRVINKLVGRVPVWIDMESGVRTNDEFDLAKVRRCLEIAKNQIP